MRAVVEYDGTKFCGLQYQTNARTVAGELEAALSALLRHPVKLTAAGRTDAGVHATGQVITFATPAAFPFERLALAMNANLPDDVSVRDVAVVDANVSARFSAVERTYVYAILNRRAPSAVLRHFAYHVLRGLDLAAMRAAAGQLIGEHDFRSFCGMLPESGPTLRAVRSLEVERRGELVRLAISADGFLHRMVRNIVGTLIECGTGRRDAAEMPAILAARARAAAGITAPARGLYLAGVRYRDGFDSFAEPPLFNE
ncbi:MAG: tRNA pseudouridine(38-40) synthase TruA [Candidatus Eremiobacteraeota bacterium]|nr:tRNA pseudouridine(38-40) synthase TruA [Candidatus Eremiobacteraeota bacterium]